MASRLRGKDSPAPPKRSSTAPSESWQPFAQFRQVVADEVLTGEPSQKILVPAPAIVRVPSGWPSEEGGSRNGESATGPFGATTTITRERPVETPVVQRSTGLPSWIRPAPGAATPESATPESAGAGNVDAGSAGVVPNSNDGVRPDLTEGAVEGRQAFRNAATLGSSLVITTAIGFAANLFYQARLGPAPSGRVAAAEGLAATTLVIMAFGLDTYARKEVALRPAHAKEFVPGVTAARVLATIPFTAALMGLMALAGRPREVIALIAFFGVVRLLVQTNELLAACLHAVGSVKGLSQQNLVTKVVWGVAMVGFLLGGLGGYSIPLAWIVGESLKFAGLARRTGRELGIWSQIGSQQVMPVLRKSVPFLSSSVVTSLAMVLDVTMMQFLTDDAEIGYYRFAQSLVLLALILATVLPWVLLPMASKAAGRSSDEFLDVMRRSLGSVMALAIPLCVLLCLNADTVVELVAPKFAPSIPALRILSVTVIGTYLTMVCATLLQASGRTWVGVRIGVFVVGLDALLVLVFVRTGWHRFGEGGAGTTAALAILLAETLGTVFYVRTLGREAWNRESLGLVTRVLLATAAVVLADRVLAAKGFSFVRAVADVVVYAFNLVLLRVVEPSKIRSHIIRSRVSPGV